MHKLTEIPVEIGDTIEETAIGAVNLVKNQKNPVVFEFNGHTIEVTDKDTTLSVIHQYNAKCEKALSEYQNTDQYKEKQRIQEDQRTEYQKKYNELVEEVDKLDFSNLSIVLQYMENLQKVTDYCGTNCHSNDLIIKAFEKKGFLPGINVGPLFKVTDKINYAQWLIGQALSGLAGEVEAIHQMYNIFHQEWKDKFSK